MFVRFSCIATLVQYFLARRHELLHSVVHLSRNIFVGAFYVQVSDTSDAVLHIHRYLMKV